MDQMTPPPATMTTPVQKSKVGKIIAFSILGVVLLLALGVIGLLSIPEKKVGIPGEVNYLPDNSRLVGYAHVNQIMNSFVVQTVLKELDKPDADAKVVMARGVLREQVGKEVEKWMGLPLEKVNDVPVFGFLDKLSSALVVHTETPVTAQELTSTRPDGKFRTVKDGTMEIHESAANLYSSFILPADKVVVYGQVPVFKATATRKSAPKYSSNMQEAITALDFGHSLGFVADIDAFKNEDLFVTYSHLAGMVHTDLPDAIPKLASAMVFADIDTNFGATVVFHCTDEAGANTVGKVVKDLMDQVKKRNDTVASSTKMEMLSIALTSTDVKGKQVTLRLGTHANKLMKALNSLSGIQHRIFGRKK